MRTLLWGEDGLFPLCILKADWITCTLDPFAGYLIGVPRLLAILIAPWPLDQWPLVTNVIAAVLAAIICGWVFFMALRARIQAPFALLLALVPVAAPLVGLEAVNVTASVYLLLLYACSVVLVTADSRVGGWPLGFMLFATALTIPTAVFLIPVVLFVLWRGRLGARAARIALGALVLGLIAQVLVILSAAGERSVDLRWESVTSWINALPSSMLTTWPGFGSQGAFLFDRFPITPFAWTGWVVLFAALALGVAGLRSSHPERQGAGILVLLGLAFSAVPALTGIPGNRYFVPLVTLWCAAGVLWLTGRARHWSPVVPWLIAAAIAVVWWPMFPASQFRHESNPPWPEQLRTADLTCAEVTGEARVTLVPSPEWPDGSTRLYEPSTMVVDCATYVAAR